MMRPYVVAVSGLSGSGKSSVVRRSGELLGDAVPMHFDDYATVSSFPENLEEWLAQGADVNAFRTPRLADDLRTLRAGRPISLPDERGVVSPAPIILLEEPFGRLRGEMAPLIDFVAYLDVPSDVLLARRLIRRIEEQRHLGDALYDRLSRDLRQYLTAGRALEARGATVIRGAADLVIGGTRSVEEISETLARHVRARRQGGA